MPDELDRPLSLKQPDGAVPETRIQEARTTGARITRLIQLDEGRSIRRTMVKGLVDGNAPYRASDLRRAGRADSCNVNWRVAEALLSQSVGAFYDVFSESSTFATVELDEQDPIKKRDFSLIATEEFQRLQSRDACWDYSMQNSQFDMVLYGVGPLFFPDSSDWRPVYIPCGDLLIPDYAKSDPYTWEEAAVLERVNVVQLYEKIRNESAATRAGWTVSEVKRVIMDAHPKTKDGGLYRTWEWHQQQLKTQSFYYSSQCNDLVIAHYFVKEFPRKNEVSGKISYGIVLIPDSEQTTNEYLFFSDRVYDRWDHLIHPLYYDNMGGGLHHSVTGMGVKMFSALEYQNRLMCNLADKAFAPKVMFKPTSGAAEQVLQLIRMGDYAQIPSGFDMVQTPILGLLDEGLAMNREIYQTVTANLSTYRQFLENKAGNPITATEVQQRASDQARLGKTQLNRYYSQLDKLYAEKYRRAVALKDKMMPGGEAAVEFKSRCLKRGVSAAALEKADRVYATRISGQGSEFLRQQSLEFLLTSIAPLLPESGRESLIIDIIAGRAGQQMAKRYYPTQVADPRREDQAAFAMVQVGAMKDGVPAVVTSTQDNELFAGLFLKAASEAAASLEQGADPMDVIKFIDTAGPAIAKHVQALAGNPMKQEEAKIMAQQLDELAKFVDKMKGQMQKQAAEQQKAAVEEEKAKSQENMDQYRFQAEEKRKQISFVSEETRKAAAFKAEQDRAAREAEMNEQKAETELPA